MFILVTETLKGEGRARSRATFSICQKSVELFQSIKILNYTNWTLLNLVAFVEFLYHASISKKNEILRRPNLKIFESLNYDIL